MPAIKCNDGKWKWGPRGACMYNSRSDAEDANKNLLQNNMNQKLYHFQVGFKCVGYGKATTLDGENIEGTRIEGYASTKDKDRQEDIVDPAAFVESIGGDFKNNPIVLFQHKADLPIGKIVKMYVDDKGLFVEAIIFDQKIGDLVTNGVLKAFSIGYIPKQVEFRDKNDEIIDTEDSGGMLRVWLEEGVKRIIQKLELLEISIVSIPANASALFSLAKSIDTFFDDEKQKFIQASIINNNNMNKPAKKEVDENVDSTEKPAENEGEKPEVEAAPAESSDEKPEEEVAASEDAEGGKVDEDKPAESSDEKPEGEIGETGEDAKLLAQIMTKEGAKIAVEAIRTLNARVIDLEAAFAQIPVKQAMAFFEASIAENKKENNVETVKTKKGFKEALLGAAV